MKSIYTDTLFGMGKTERCLEAVINEREKFVHTNSEPSLTLRMYSKVTTWVILLFA
jgi:hypothetical protein